MERGNAGAGSLDYLSGLDDADAMITRESDAALCILTADCIPVAIYGAILPPSRWCIPAGKVPGGRSPGWSSRNSERAYGSKRGGGRGVTLGPGIRSCCYEVAEERAGSFRRRFGDDCVRGSRLDLYRAIRLTLLRAGVREDMIRDTGVCTSCGPDYYSYRREGTTGRQAAILQMTGVDG